MNPIFFIDELDKVSDSSRGEEIINTLIHLTDSTQNDTFFELSRQFFSVPDRDRRLNHDDRLGIARSNRGHHSVNAAGIERIGVGVIIGWRCN